MPGFGHRTTVGQQRARAALHAGKAGDAGMRLDTSRRLAVAMALCDSLGFCRTAAYHDLIAKLADWLVFFQCDS